MIGYMDLLKLLSLIIFQATIIKLFLPSILEFSEKYCLKIEHGNLSSHTDKTYGLKPVWVRVRAGSGLSTLTLA